ncbi:hypothetical protein BDZ94DRAFT_843638 [Collybia nuda]|uniref:DUF6534 domain-containing protein n=1 Tax=Collybia nuda TaxID=64659 RepID=A0A9P5YFW4_9AGAR|nr:hypothetical protein BDZ94DRAFT_843638 [Collybia nuda]
MSVPHLDLGNTFGAMFVGAMVTMSIYGITTLQMYFYYMTYPNDDNTIKTLVATIWTIDTLHVILMCHAMYFYLITGFGNPHALAEGTWSLYVITSIALNVLMAFLVQCFFTQRIFKLSSPRIKWWLSGIIALCVVAHFCFGMETVVWFFLKKDFARLKEANFQSVLPFAITAILSDIMIAVTLCLLLASNRSEFQDTNNIINRLIIYAINRCILTSAVAVVEVVIFVALPNSFWSFAFDFIIGKLYANSLLASLNSRKSLRGKGQNTTSTEGTSTSFNLASMSADGPTSLVHVPSQSDDGETANVIRRLNVSDGNESKHIMTSSTMHKSRKSYPCVN